MRKLLVIILTTFLFGYFAIPAYASSGLTVGYVGGKGLSPEVIPGERYTQTLTVNIGKDGNETDVLIEVLGYGSSLENDTIPLLPEEDTSKYSARSFIQPGQISIHCQPGENKETQINISIPANTIPGGYYAILRFSTSPKAGSGIVGIIQSIVLTMKFTVTNGPFIHTAEILGVSTNEAVSGKPVEIFTAVKNTGNHHFNTKGQVEVKDSSGKPIDTLYFTTLSPIADGIKRIKTNLIPKEDLSQGVYSIKSTLTLEDGSLLDEATGSFEVKEPYVPPPAPASITVKPESAATLQTEDGRIAINFPVGAVLGQAELALRSYPPEQLPSPPTGYTSGTTTFRVDGLNGLLAKSATLKVQYSTADLEKAANNQANRLVLARWDESSNQWVIAKTKVDSATMSLTAETNQFGLWSVMAAPPSPGINWTIIGSIIALIVIVLILGVFFLPKKKKSAK